MQPEPEEQYETKSAKPYLEWIKENQKALDPWQNQCDRIDKVYASAARFSGVFPTTSESLIDREFNIYWASVQVILPSVYSRAPIPVVTPKFKDRSPVKRVTAELLERSSIAGFDLTDIDQVMINVRNGLVLHGRGVMWVTYESEEGEDERVCVERLNRREFVHDMGRDWSEVKRVARGAWMSRKKMKKRFEEHSDDLYLSANYSKRKENEPLDTRSLVEQCLVWEIWDSEEDEVTWVTEGCDEVLEQGPPHLKLIKKFPCPRPAYGTLEPDTLKPTPLFNYILDQMGTINELTVRIHDLTQAIVVKGLVPSGTDIGDAVEAAYRQNDASHMLIPVPAMSLTSGAAKLVEWLPLDAVLQAILAAVEARRELIGNVQELLGVADIDRGDTNAEETLGAQRLKVQKTSNRVRDMVNELVRIARDTLCIAAEIMGDEFEFDTLMTMAQMELPTDAEIKSQLSDLRKAAEKELKDLADKAEAIAANPEAQENLQAAEQQFQQAQQQIIAKYAPQIEKLSNSVTIEAVKKLLDDDKTRPFVFDIETDSTIYPDEQAAKQASAEMMNALGGVVPLVQGIVATGGAKFAGELIKDALAPFRPGRSTTMALDEWIEMLENAPPQQQGNGAEAEVAAAQSKLAEAEILKAQAQGQNYQAQAQLKMQELEQRGAESAAKIQQDQERFMLEIEKSRGTVEETGARIQEIYARIQAMNVKTSNETRAQDREDAKFVVDAQRNAQQDAMAEEGQAFDQSRQIAEGQRADRSQQFNEQQGTRQQDFAEQQANRGDDA